MSKLTPKNGRQTAREVRYELLRPAQIIKRRRALPLAYLPLGVIEWHGRQNPVGLDGLKVHELCIRAAVQGGGLVFPVLWYGENRESHLAEVNPPGRSAVAKAMQLNPENFTPGHAGGGTALEQTVWYQQLLWRVLHQIKSLGFHAVYVLAGHVPLRLPALLTAQIFERSTGVRVAVSDAAGLVKGYTEDHAGRFETGVLMELRPELVDLKSIAGRSKRSLVGINGEDPRQGAAETGQVFVPAAVRALAGAGRELVRRRPSTGVMQVR
jgi:creatinine amidohydrolase